MADRKDEPTGFERAANKAKDFVGGMVGRISAKTAGARSSEAFIRNAAIGDMYEIEAATIALAQARSPRVKEIAQTMIDDHMTSSHHLGSALLMNETRGEAPFPDGMDERRLKMIEHLREAPESSFDETYLDQQILAHKETVDLMTGYRDRGSNPQLRSLAASTAPVVRRHLRWVGSLRRELVG